MPSSHKLMLGVTLSQTCYKVLGIKCQTWYDPCWWGNLNSNTVPNSAVGVIRSMMKAFTWDNGELGHFCVVEEERIRRILREGVTIQLSWLWDVPHDMEAEMGRFKELGALWADTWEKAKEVFVNFVFRRTVSNMLWLRCRVGEGEAW